MRSGVARSIGRVVQSGKASATEQEAMAVATSVSERANDVACVIDPESLCGSAPRNVGGFEYARVVHVRMVVSTCVREDSDDLADVINTDRRGSHSAGRIVNGGESE